MFSSVSVRLLIFSGALLWVPLSGVARAQANPAQTAPDDVSKVRGDITARQEFIKQFEQKVGQDSTVALGYFRQWVKEHPDLDAEQMIRTYQESSYILWKHDAKQLEQALGILTEVEALFPTHPARFRAWSNHAIMLSRSGRVSEAETLWKSIWPQAQTAQLADYERQVMVQQYFSVLMSQDKKSDAQQLLWSALAKSPMMLTWDEFPTMMIATQPKEGSEAALEWAKLRFVMANFDEESIKKATQLLTRQWMVGANLDMDSVRAFGKAQSDASAPNPLDKVELPQFPAEVKSALEIAATSGRAPVRFVALLALERNREAMLMARETLIRQPTSPQGVEQVARVFKAADGDVARANAFVAYYNSGQGENPMKAFLEETPAP